MCSQIVKKVFYVRVAPVMVHDFQDPPLASFVNNFEYLYTSFCTSWYYFLNFVLFGIIFERKIGIDPCMCSRSGHTSLF